MARTLVLLDTSSSMEGRPIRQAASLAVALGLKGGVVVPFDDRVHPPIRVGESPLLTVDRLVQGAQGGTFLGQAVDHAAHLAQEGGFLRLVVLTDERAHDDALLALRRFVEGDPRRQAHVINLLGYDPTVTSPHPRLHRQGGFSSWLLDFLTVMEAGGEGVRGYLARWERVRGLEWEGSEEAEDEAEV